MESGFYKNEGGALLYAPSFVAAPEFTLLGEEKDNYKYPVGGWYWFESLDAANRFFGQPSI